jgi:hypothetical protein
VAELLQYRVVAAAAWFACGVGGSLSWQMWRVQQLVKSMHQLTLCGGKRSSAMLPGRSRHILYAIMENFISLQVTSGNSKINAINNLTSNFKVDMLCGCEPQVDWKMVPQD